MEQIFTTILRTSLSGSVIILVILALRLVMRNMPKRFLCLLWLLAVVRLLIPFTIESPLSLQPDPDRFKNAMAPEHSAVQEESPPIPAVPDSNTEQHPSPDVVIGDADISKPDIVTIDTTAIAATVWTAVACGFLTYTAVSYFMLKRKVRDAVQVDDGIYECAAIDTPFLLGYLKPNIYLPAGLPLPDIEHILAHEQAHIRRFDNWTKLLGFLALSLHWFNPLVWVAYILLCRDIEIACDEAVIAEMPVADRKAYSTALLRCAARHRLGTVCPVAFGEISVKQRIPKVLNYRKPGFWISIITVIVMIVVAVCFLTSPITLEPHTGIEWLRQLQVEDVASVRFTVSETPLSYTEYDDSELQEIVSLLRSCDAKETGGVWAFVTDNRYFTITMCDGSVHRVGICTTNVPTVEIDGILYSNCEEWISRLPTEGEVQVDMIVWSAQVLEAARGGDMMYLHVWNKDGNPAHPEITWRRVGTNWERITDDGSTCERLLHYDGFQFRHEYSYMGNDTIISNSGWQKASFDADIVLPWPLNATLTPEDWALVKTANENGALTVTLRYKPDGTLLHLSYQGSSPYTFYDLEYSDGTVTCGSFMEPSSVGTDLILMGEYAAAIGKHEDMPPTEDPTGVSALVEKCRKALENFHSQESYAAKQVFETNDDSVLNNKTTLNIFVNGDNWLRINSFGNVDEYFLQKDGRQFIKYVTTAMPQEDLAFADWTERDFSTLIHGYPDLWLNRFDWDAHLFLESSCTYDSTKSGQKIIHLTVADTTAPQSHYELQFVFDSANTLISVTREKTWLSDTGEHRYVRHTTILYANPPEAIADHIDAHYQEATQ